MKFKHIYITCIILCCISLCGCESHNENETLAPAEDIFSDSVALPEWLNNYFDYGTYEEKIQVASDAEDIEINDKIKIPESTLLSVLLQTPCSDVHLYKDTKENVKELIATIQKISVTLENEESAILNASETVVSDIILINSKSNYIKINTRSYDDGRHIFTINDNNNVMYCSAFSTELTNKLYEISDLGVFNIEDVNSIISLEYDKNGSDEKREFNQDNLNTFIKGIQTSEQIRNFSTGCPFNNIMKITLDDNISLNARYASDGCGIFIIEDKSYKIDKLYLESFNNMFYMDYE